MKEVLSKAKALVAELVAVIPALEDPKRMEELLSLNDQLTTLLEALPATPAPARGRPVLTPLLGVGLGLNLGSGGDSKGSDRMGVGMGGMPNGNSILHGDAEEERGDDTPTTPRVDKGKAKAEPPPEEPEKVLSPTFMLTESSSSEDEDEDARFVMAEEDLEGPASPTHR